MFGVDRNLHIVADDAGASAALCHRAGVGIGERDLLVWRCQHLRFETLEALHLLRQLRDLLSEPGREPDLQLGSGAIYVTAIKHKPVKTIKVGAPYLTASPEGGRIAVSIQSSEVSAVAVASGTVTVTNTATGETKTVAPGSTALVSRDSITIKTELITEKLPEEPKPVWIMKDVRIVTKNAEDAFDRALLPKPGDYIKTGTQISTIAKGDTEVWVELLNTNGHDTIKVQPGTIMTMGDDDPAMERRDLAILKGAIEIETAQHAPGQTMSIYAPHLVATVANSKCIVSTTPRGSAVFVKDGSATVASILTGVTKEVPVGVLQLVRSRNTPPLKITPEMGTVEQMQ